MRIKKAKLKAFSLVELIVAMFIFFLVVTASTSVFVSVISTRKKANNVQRNLENARYALELMAKNIRMSTNLTDNGSPQTIYMFNNSQDKCVSYKFNSGKIEESIVDSTDPKNDDCLDPNSYFSSYNPIVSGSVSSLKFGVVSSVSPPLSKVGKVTISLEIVTGSGNSADTAKIQTTVSLRDYKTVGM